MSIDLMNEVWDHAPEDVNGSELTVLLAIADMAQDIDRKVNGKIVPARACFPSPEEFGKRLRLSPDSLRKVFQRLAKRGLEVRVPISTTKAGNPMFAVSGHKSMYRLPNLIGGKNVPPNDQLDGKAIPAIGGQGVPPNDELAGNVVRISREDSPEKAGSPSRPNHKNPNRTLPPAPRGQRTTEQITDGMEGNVPEEKTAPALPDDLRAALAAHGIPASRMQAVRRIAAQDPDSNYPDQRLIKVPAYAKDCLRQANAAHEAQRAAAPRCIDHPEQPASRCNSCIADIKAGERPRALMGKHMPHVPEEFNPDAPFG